jgi:hypothetical protein
MMAREARALEPRSTDEKILHEWAKSLYDEGMARRRYWEGVWWENLATYMGDFWAEWDIHRRRLTEPIKKAEHRVRVPINLSQPVVRTELAKLTKNRPILDVTARSSDQSDLNSAKVGDKVLNNYVEREFHMARVRRRMLMWVLIMGSGGIIVDWDETALGELEVLCDEGGNPIFDPRVIEAYKQQLDQTGKKPNYKRIPQGELIIKVASPFQIMFDFSQLYIEDAWWCMFTDVYDVDEVYRRWKKRVNPEPVQPGVIEQRLVSRFDLTGSLNVRPPHVQQLAQVTQMWVKPGHPKFPDGLCFVFTKDAVLLKQAYDRDYGELPVHMMGHIPMPTQQFSLSVLQQIKGPVVELSKTESQMIENRNLMTNPPWLIPKQLQITKPIVNKPGARIEFNYMPNIPEPHPVEMPDLPAYVKDMPAMLREHILEIGGQGETSQGRVPPGARSGVAIAYLQEEDDTRIGVTVQEFEEVSEAVGNHILRLIAEKYVTPRVVRIYKKHGDDEVFDFFGSMLDGAGAVIVQAGSALPRSKAAKQQYILDLWDRKLEQDPRKVRQMLELAEGEPDEWEVDLDQAERENHKLQNGEDPGVREWYNHPAHHYVHRNYMKSADFDALPQQTQQLFLEHDEEHTYYEQIQAQQAAQTMAQQQAPPPGGGGGSSNGAAPQGSSVPAGANGQNVPQGPPSQFTAATTPRSLLEATPQ